MEDAPASHFRFLALWGVVAYASLLGWAVVRLVPLALQPIRAGKMSPGVWALYGVSILFNGYAEGYRAFQRKVAPRVVARSIYLAQQPTPLRVILAPLFLSGLFHATRRRVIATWIFFVGLISLIVAVHQLDQPWRGAVDAGVVVGLTWGVVATIVLYVRALGGRPPPASWADLPEERGKQQERD